MHFIYKVPFHLLVHMENVFFSTILKVSILEAVSISLKTGTSRGFPGGAVVENLPANAGDTGSSPGLGRSHMPWSN